MTEDKKIDISVNIAGIAMNTPLIMASGTFGYGFEVPRVEGFRFEDVGAIILKSVTLKPRQGNRPHRIAETPAGVLNSIGMQNPGVEYVVKNYFPMLKKMPAKFIANVGGESAEEYVEVAKIIDGSDVVVGIELNISCPNVKDGCAIGVDPHNAAALVKAVKAACAKPVIVKLTPGVTDIQTMARACVDAGADALSVGNTYTGMVIDTRTRRPVLGNNYGGLSGPAIRPLTVCNVHKVRQALADSGVPIIAFGGVSNAVDAAEVLLAGASAVGVGTAVFADTHVCTDIAEGLREYLRSQNETSVADIVGTVKLN